MGASRLVVVITATALGDLHAIDDYWTKRGESERGRKYFDDLMQAAEHELSDRERAERGRLVKNAPQPNTREILVFKSSYRIFYRLDIQRSTVFVLRFWHTHRDETFAE